MQKRDWYRSVRVGVVRLIGVIALNPDLAWLKRNELLRVRRKGPNCVAAEADNALDGQSPGGGCWRPVRQNDGEIN